MAFAQKKPVTEQLWLHLPSHFLNTCMHVHKSLSKEMLIHKLGRRGTTSLACPKSRLLTQHNQEIAQ